MPAHQDPPPGEPSAALSPVQIGVRLRSRQLRDGLVNYAMEHGMSRTGTTYGVIHDLVNTYATACLAGVCPAPATLQHMTEQAEDLTHLDGDELTARIDQFVEMIRHDLNDSVLQLKARAAADKARDRVYRRSAGR